MVATDARSAPQRLACLACLKRVGLPTRARRARNEGWVESTRWPYLTQARELLPRRMRVGTPHALVGLMT
jgi:hypothetical protein